MSLTDDLKAAPPWFLGIALALLLGLAALFGNRMLTRFDKIDSDVEAIKIHQAKIEAKLEMMTK